MMDSIAKLIDRIKQTDRFARMAGIEIGEVRPGYAQVSMKVEDKHLNSVNITHGGAIFTLADMAFALASNSHGTTALALNVSINFLKATEEGAVLMATATEDKLTNRTGLYRLNIVDEKGDTVAIAEGLAYRIKK